MAKVFMSAPSVGWWRVLRGWLLFAGILAIGATSVSAQGPLPSNIGGEWTAPIDWMPLIDPPSCADSDEFSHAALIPKGPYAGQVLLWRLEVIPASDPPGTCLLLNTTESWIYDPNTTTMAKVPQNYPSPIVRSIFCSGASWDARGDLLVVGGVDGYSYLWPRQTYRFKPNRLGALQPPAPPSLFPTIAWSNNPWIFVADTVIPHYYATVLSLRDEAVLYSGTSFLPLLGGSSLVLGGPPQWTIEGNEFWEVLEPGAMSYRQPLLNLTAPGSSALHSGSDPGAGLRDVYDRLPSASPAEPRLDSYPRAVQLKNGDILICGDVDSLSPETLTWWKDNAGTPGLIEPYGSWAPPGAWWVLRPRYAANSLNNAWELWQPTGPQTVAPVDSFYDNVALMYRLATNLADEVYRFGGSSPLAMSNAHNPPQPWTVNDRLMKFVPGAAPNSNVNGSWSMLAQDARYERVFSNLIVLPTGELLAVGGTSQDDYGGHGGGPSSYIPGSGNAPPALPTYSAPQYAPVLIDPQNPAFPAPMNPQSIPRLYHSLGLLLPDGRVLSAGGHPAKMTPPPPGPSPKYSAEIFSPPYLFQGFQPSIDSAPGATKFGDPIQITVERGAERWIDRIVLLRPASVTHHFDNDQRYIELVHSVASTQISDTEFVLDTINVTMPGNQYGPPGYYMLFAIENDNSVRVPSTAVFINIQ